MGIWVDSLGFLVIRLKYKGILGKKVCPKMERF